MEIRMQPHNIVSEQKWIGARKALLAKEKAFTKERDRIGAERRALQGGQIGSHSIFTPPT